MSAQRNHLNDGHLYGSTGAPVSHKENSSAPSAAFNREAESASLAVRYEAPRSNPNAQICSHTSCHLKRVSSFLCSFSHTSGCCGNALQSTGSLSSRLSLPHSAPFSNCNDPNTSTITDNSLRCNICDTKFTGKFGRGNLARHVKHKHAKASKVPYKCRLAACPKVFARSDARRKHERKQHPWLHPTTTAMAGPVPHAEGSTTPTSAMYQPIEYLRDSPGHNMPSQYWPGRAQFSQYEPSHGSDTNYFPAPAMSRLSSSQAFNDHDAFNYHPSLHTGPSSINDPVDNAFLSPHVPVHPYTHTPHTADPCSYDTAQVPLLDSLDFPEASAEPDDPRYIPTSMPGYIDPSLLLL